MVYLNETWANSHDGKAYDWVEKMWSLVELSVVLGTVQYNLVLIVPFFKFCCSQEALWKDARLIILASKCSVQ